MSMKVLGRTWSALLLADDPGWNHRLDHMGPPVQLILSVQSDPLRRIRPRSALRQYKVNVAKSEPDAQADAPKHDGPEMLFHFESPNCGQYDMEFCTKRRCGFTARPSLTIGHHKGRIHLVKTLLAALGGIACSFLVPAADLHDAQSVLVKYHAARPKDVELAIYRLDWAPTLQLARERAATAGRPIFLVVVINSFGNIRSGHC
jgi:hypothetical protein